MPPKRKAEESALPSEVDVEPIRGKAPFAAYFPSGFNPELKDAQTTWETYAHGKRKNQYAVVAKTVSCDVHVAESKIE